MYRKYFFPQAVSIGPELAIRAVGVEEVMVPGICDRPTGTGDCLMMLFYDPVYIDRVWYEQPMLRIWETGASQHYGNPNASYQHSWIHCDGELPRKLVKELGLSMDEPVPCSCHELLERALDEILDEMLSPDGIDADIVGNLFENMLRRVARTRSLKGSSAIPQNFLRVKDHIERNYRAQLALKDLAGMAGCSIPHFCAEFKRHFGTSAVEYAIRLRMEEARYLLSDANLNIGEISERIGINDIYYFSRLFKKRHGVSPQKMRKRLQ